MLFFEVPEAPGPEEVEAALDVLRRHLEAAGAPATAASAGAMTAGPSPERGPGRAERRPTVLFEALSEVALQKNTALIRDLSGGRYRIERAGTARKNYLALPS